MFEQVAAEIEDLDHRGLAQELRRIERERRALLAREAAAISAAERSTSFGVDGHKSINGWVRANTNCQSSEASRRVRAARVCHDQPHLGDALLDGVIGAEHINQMTRVHRNPRCRERLDEIVESMLQPDRVTMPFPHFKACIDRVLVHLDDDGAQADLDHRHDDRNATVTELAGGVFIHAEGPGINGLEMIEIFQRFLHAEVLADWHHATAIHGPNAAKNQLARTDAQRRYDALHAIFRAAATAPADGIAPAPMVNIVINEHVFTDHLAQRTGNPRPHRSIDELIDARSETIDGTPIHPSEVLAAALAGEVRRVIYNADSVPIDFGREQRLFRRRTRAAAQLRNTHCIWPGCNTPTQHCQIDHIQPWAAGGRTDVRNAAPCCARHNRYRNHGYTIRRDPTGHWHTYRPDGTELAPTQLHQAA